jgi:hypothetical protein
MGMLVHMGEEGISEGHEQRRVYPPHEVQSRLAVSAYDLRRLAGIYERTMGPLPRDERGRVWPEDAVEALEDARALVRESRAVSIEAALRGQEVRVEAEPYPATQRPSRENIDSGTAILEELRGLREAVSEQNRLLAEQGERLKRLEAGTQAELIPVTSDTSITPAAARDPGQDTLQKPEDAQNGNQGWLRRHLPEWIGSATVSTIIGLVLSNGVSIASIVVATISALNGQEVLALLAALSGVITGLVGTYFGVKASSDARAGATQQRIKANKEASVRAKNNEQR